MKFGVRSCWLLVAGAFLNAAGSASLMAQPVGDFYKGKTITLIVGSAAGGGYDALARRVAKHIFVHIPGKPNIAVRNMPGAGGIIAANYITRNAARDGTVLALVQNNVPFEPLMGNKRAKYNPVHMNWIGSPSIETGLLIVWHEHAARTIQDATRMKIRVGSSGYSSAPSMYARLLNRVLGTKLDVIIGYRGQPGAFAAMQKRVLDSYGVTYWSALTSTKRKWLKQKKIRILLQYGPVRPPELGAIPHAADMIKKPEDRKLLEAAYGPLSVGRPFVMAAGVRAPQVAALRRAFMATLADPKFKKDAKRGGLVINYPQAGEKLQERVALAYRTPSPLIARLRRIANPPKK